MSADDHSTTPSIGVSLLGRRIKAAAKALRVSRTSLGVMAPQNDPYALDNPTNHRAGRWFAEQIVSFVTADGALVKGGGRVVKNVAGYDFPKLLTGSLGTLGIITQLTLKVRPVPEADALAWVPLPTSARLEETLERLNTSGTRPVAVEVVNREAAPLIRGGSGDLRTDARALVVPKAAWLPRGASGLVLEIDIRQRLTVMVAHHEAR